MMKAKNYLPYIVILLALVTEIFISGCVTQKPSPSNLLLDDKLPVIVGEGHAWYDLMPGAADSKHPHISVPVTIENKAGFDLNDLQIYEVEVMQDGKVVGDFKPWFQIDYPSYENSPECYTSSEQNPRKFDLKDGCELQFNIRANRKGDNTAGIDGNKPIKVRFKFVNNAYFTDTYESDEMNVDKAS